MEKFTVYIDDNFHFMDDDERYSAGEFNTLREAVEKCRGIILEDLKHLLKWKPDLTAEQLAGQWSMWGEDPWISSGEFSAIECVREMSAVLVNERDRRSGRATPRARA